MAAHAEIRCCYVGTKDDSANNAKRRAPGFGRKS